LNPNNNYKYVIRLFFAEGDGVNWF